MSNSLYAREVFFCFFILFFFFDSDCYLRFDVVVEMWHLTVGS